MLQKSYVTFFNLVFLTDYNKVKQVREEIKWLVYYIN